MFNCPYCNRELEEETTVCPYCNHEIPSMDEFGFFEFTSPDEEQNDNSEPEPKIANTDTDYLSEDEEKKLDVYLANRKKRSGFFFLRYMIVLAVLLIIVALLPLSSSQETTMIMCAIFITVIVNISYEIYLSRKYGKAECPFCGEPFNSRMTYYSISHCPYCGKRIVKKQNR